MSAGSCRWSISARKPEKCDTTCIFASNPSAEILALKAQLRSDSRSNSVVVQIAGGDATARGRKSCNRLWRLFTVCTCRSPRTRFPIERLNVSWFTPSAGGARRVPRADVGDQQGVLRDHRIEGSHELRRIDPVQHRADCRPASVRRRALRALTISARSVLTTRIVHYAP